MEIKNSSTDFRPSPIAGQWYPGDPQTLASNIDSYLHKADVPQLTGEVIGIVAPHAGYMYSGAVAGYAFAALRGLTPDLVAILSPMHHPYPHPLLTTAHNAYQTPLGGLPVDRSAVQALEDILQADVGFGLQAIPKDPEHSLEIELPFLQRVFQHPFRLLPVMMRDQTPALARALGHGLAHVLQDQSSLLIASSDLSHFYPQTTAEALDGHILRCIEALDPMAVLEAEQKGKGYACGRGAIAALLWAAEALGADAARVIQYATSGDVTGDYTSVVGYSAVVVTRTEPGRTR